MEDSTFHVDRIESRGRVDFKVAVNELALWTQALLEREIDPDEVGLFAEMRERYREDHDGELPPDYNWQDPKQRMDVYLFLLCKAVVHLIDVVPDPEHVVPEKAMDELMHTVAGIHHTSAAVLMCLISSGWLRLGLEKGGPLDGREQ